MVKGNKDIKGIVIGKTKRKLPFADDTELFQDGDRATFNETIRLLNDFENKSGLKINIDKSVVVWLGIVTYVPHLKFEWNPTKFRILSICFTNDLKGCTQ